MGLFISPLKLLQVEQAAKFNAMGIPAVAVNGDTWDADSEMAKKLKSGAYRAIFAGPEMCRKHEPFRACIRELSKRFCVLGIDEGHCVYQWGGKFRPDYSLLAELLALLPIRIPILVVSATMNRKCLKTVTEKLTISLNTSFFLNLGNDRPNISTSVVHMNSSEDYAALEPFLVLNAKRASDVTSSPFFDTKI
ncbi:Bloom syndrome [Mycena indigotica]|uniref:Bloom syndrome n=1 Tax=Mycena indigotica TaxID=2126181 RepID=A0A8H6W4P2_9AGAR|nr:Bloom syndrome [Mycena indigotica]KAF7299139.1 Bloom syndrome [Mycena indigotica]